MNELTGFAAFWRRLCDALDLLTRTIVGLCVLAIVLITIVSVWYRYVLDAPLSWTEQVSRILFVWSVFAGAAWLYRHLLHIAIDMAVVMLPAPVQKIAFWINQVLMLFIGLMTFGFGMQIVIGTWAQTFGALEITPATFYSSAPYCGLLIVIFFIEKVIDPSKRTPSGVVHI